MKGALFLLAAVLVSGGPVLSGSTSQTIEESESARLQDPPPAVTVALVDRLPRMRNEQYDALVIRWARPERHDVILLPRGKATGQLLDAATRVLLDARARQVERSTRSGARPFTRMTLGVHLSEAPDEWRQKHMVGAHRIVDRLYDAPERPVRGAGKVPALDFYPPAPAAPAGR